MDQHGANKLKPLDRQLSKLPIFLRPSSPHDMLTYAENKMGVINVFQLYMKVEGNRTGVHREDLNVCSANLNIGPASCLWYFVSDTYWAALNDYAKTHGMNFFGREWWPDLKELEKANIPVFVAEQKAGGVIFTNVGTIHWVESNGKTNNVAWNFAPQTVRQYNEMMNRYIFNIDRKVPNIIPFKHIIWNMARRSKALRPSFHGCLV